MSIKTPWVDKRLMCESQRSLSELKAIGHWVIWAEKATFNFQRRSVLVGCYLDNKSFTSPRILIPEYVEVGSQVHEYGGGSWTGWIDKEDNLNLVYVDSKRGGVFHFVNEIEKKIAPFEGVNFEKNYYADFEYSSKINSILCVRETRFPDHSEKSALIRISLDSLKEEKLEDDADFYAFPRISSDGKKLAWIEWNHPLMPWDESALKIREIHGEKIHLPSLTNKDHFVTEPHWQDDDLWVLSDFDGLCRPIKFSNQKACLLPNLKLEAGLPLWQLGQDTYLPLKDGSLLLRVNEEGLNKLKLCISANNWTTVEGISPAFSPVILDDGSYAVINASTQRPLEIIHFNLDKSGNLLSKLVLRKASENWTEEQSQKVSKAQFLEIPIADNKINKISALYYAPLIRKEESDGSMVVRVHGGPTAQCTASFDLDVQFWTSRGFAVLDVNYRGSTGFGTEFRKALNYNWGVLDVEDCITACQYVISQGLASEDKCFIRGSSAGGFTVLTALKKMPGLFRAGCVRYGVSDLSDLVHSSHRFESHYTDQLIASFETEKEVYEKRSPINWADQIGLPVLLLHGKKDRVVPFEQTEKIAKKLLHSETHFYEDEGHGFRVLKTRYDALEREYNFYIKALKG